MNEIGPKSWKELKCYIRRDLKWVNGHKWRTFFSRYFFEEGFRYSVWLRMTRYFYLKGKAFKPMYAISRIILKHYGHKYAFDISYKAQIGPGLTIAHYGYIIVGSSTVIGSDCHLKPGTIFGKKQTEETGGAIIGNNVNVGAGCKIVGDVKIGDNVFIGANAVVTKDIPSNCVAAGVPAKVIRYIDNEE